MELEAKFSALRDLLLQTVPDPSVVTDSSILVVYPPEEEQQFRDGLHKLLDFLGARGSPLRHLDLSTLPFEVLEVRGLLADAMAHECEDLGALKRGLARAVQEGLYQRIEGAAAEVPNGAVILSATSALYPLVKFADLLTGLRHLRCRLVVPFPGREDGGKLHFMNQRDGYNYLAVKIN